MSGMMRPVRRRLSSQRGQAMTETVLMTLPLVMLLAGVYQLFLADEYVFRLAARSHARLFTEAAFVSNSTSARYAWRFVEWNTREVWVPVVGFFRPYGLSNDQMRIRSARGGGRIQADGDRGGHGPVGRRRGRRERLPMAGQRRPGDRRTRNRVVAVEAFAQ